MKFRHFFRIALTISILYDTTLGNLQPTKNQIYNQVQLGPTYTVNDCGYVSLNQINDGGPSQVKSNTQSTNFIFSNTFPPEQKDIQVNDTEIAEVIQLAKKLFDTNCKKENALRDLKVATVQSQCLADDKVALASNMTNLVDIIYDLLAYRHNVGRYDVVKFVTNQPLPLDVCNPNMVDSKLSELDRLLPPYCVSDDSVAIRTLPPAKTLSSFLDLQKREEDSYRSTCLNPFGFFLFQAFSNDIQNLVRKSSCGNQCLNFKGCSKDDAMSNTLRSNSINVCIADPFYKYYGKNCVSYQKLQNLNKDCEIRKRSPMNKATPYIDLSHLYESLVAGQNYNVTFPGPLPVLTDFRALQTTPLQVVHILKGLSHDVLARMLKSAFNTLSDAQVFEYAKKYNVFIFQRVLYEYLLPLMVGTEVTEQNNLKSTNYCYDPLSKVRMDVETIVVALRYCHAYIPKEYQLMSESYNVVAKKGLDEILNSEKLIESYKDVLRGLFATKIRTEDRYMAQCQCPWQQKPISSEKKLTDDLRTLDIEAGRDTCIEPYLQYLKLVRDVPTTDNWQAYERFFPADRLKRLSELYDTPQDMELAVGGSLDIRQDSIFGDVFGRLVGKLFGDLRCSDPKFWTNSIDGAKKDLISNLDVQDWIACVGGLKQRPSNLFCPFGADNPLVPVTCKSRDALVAYFSTITKP